MKRIFGLLKGRHDPVPIEWGKLKPRVCDIVTKAVARLGLTHQSGLQWVSEGSDEDGIRRLFRVHDAGAGRPFSANWGYSFDFVPHVSSDKVQWHRTFKSARRDYWVVPPETMVPRTPQHDGEAVFLERWDAMTEAGILQAERFFAQGHRLSDLPTLLSTAAHELHIGTQIDNGTRPRASSYALPFALARLRQMPEAGRVLSTRFEDRPVSDNLREDLLEKLRQAGQA